MNNGNNKNNLLSGCAMVLIVLGLVFGAVRLVKMFQAPMTFLGTIFNCVYFLTHVAMAVYVFWNDNKSKAACFQGIVLAYAALLGIQTLQSGQSIANLGLSENMTLMINIFNLIAFANVIMFSNRLNIKKTAAGYMAMAAGLKLVGELILIFASGASVTPYIALISLSIPVLGVTILCLYLGRYEREA